MKPILIIDSDADQFLLFVNFLNRIVFSFVLCYSVMYNSITLKTARR